MVVNEIMNGKYKGKPIGAIFKKAVITIKMTQPQIQLNADTVRSYRIISQDTQNTLGRSFTRTALFGIAGAATSSQSEYIIELTWKDGDTSLIRADKKLRDAIIRNCPLSKN